ncbi:MAG: hypothetical protein GTN62_02675 [Gemmatimonadales bacterium]|nr:hypothetical protein [Gemmatimonadales bacterium]NIP06467.1 hypothetical protein [Gemmatimonadales bacterium]
MRSSTLRDLTCVPGYSTARGGTWPEPKGEKGNPDPTPGRDLLLQRRTTGGLNPAIRHPKRAFVSSFAGSGGRNVGGASLWQRAVEGASRAVFE